MSQESRLSITIDSRPAKKNADELSGALDRVEQSGESAAASAQNLSQVSVTLGSNLGKMASAATRALGQIEKSTASTDQQISALTAQVAQLAGGFNAFSASQAAVNTQLTRLASSLEKTAAGARQADTSMEGVSRSSKAAEASIDQQRRELAQLIGQINPAVSALDRLDAMQQKLAKYRKAGLVDSDTFNEYTQRINTMRDAIGETAEGMNKGGMSAKAYNAALRGLPAQFTDIAVSLQAGQAPLTVFLQQGGQLKDMFGGVGPAARAMGGYILGLVNPFTVAAAAAGVLALAYYQGSEESQRFANVLIETGNASGVSANALADMANQVSSTTGTFSAAASVLTQLASAGNPLRSMYAEITKASINWSKQTGRDISEVVQTFNEIGKNPVEAIKKLDDKLNILTASQYANIQSLEEQGKTMDAAAVAAGIYAEAINSRAGEIERNLGALESVWQSIAEQAKKAWDAMLDVGRTQTLEDQIANTEKLIAQRKGGIIGFFAGEDDETLRFLETRLKQLQNALAGNAAKAAQEASDNAIQAAGKKGVDLINSTYKSSLSQTQQLQSKLTELDKARSAAIAAGGFSAAEEEKYAKSRKNIEQEIADIKAREAKKNKPKKVRENNRGVSEAENTFARLYGQYDPAAQAARTLTKEQGQLDLALSKGKITQEEYGKALAQASLNYAAAIKGAQGLTQAEQYRAQLERQLNTQRSEYSTAAAGVGMGDQQVQRMQQRIQLEQQTNDRILQLRTELANASTEKQRQDLQAQINLEEEYLPKRLAALQAGFAQYDAAVSSPLNGWNAALASFQVQAANVAGQTESLFTNAFSNIQSGVGSAFEAMALDGQTFGESISNITRSLLGGVINALGQMAAQWAVNQALQVAFGTTQQALSASEIVRINAETAARLASISATTSAKVAADGVMTASSLAATTATTTAQTAAAATTASAWLPAALVASIGSFGAAAVVGGTALLAAFALIKGFSSGGYTGRGGVNEPAGIVHKGEVVWSQADIKRFGGVSAVESMRTGGAGAIRSAVSSDPSTGYSSRSGSQQRQAAPIQQNVNIYNQNGSQIETRRRSNGDMDIIIREAVDRAVEQVAGQLSSGVGAVVDSGEAAYGWHRRGG